LLLSISFGESKTMSERNEASRTRSRPLVGAQVRRLRTERGLTLAQVGEMADLNVGYLSQVENDKASPSLETLAAIADVFEVPITWLLVDAAPAPHVVRRHERRVQTTPDGIRLEEVDGGFARGLRIVEGLAPPGSASGLMSDAGEEHHLVLEGTIRLRQGDFVADLGPGDYLVWDGCFPHQAENTGDGPARLLIITPGPSAVGVSPATAEVEESRS
jgi:transcriptional regulator with XRE-family HTH domain